MFKKKLDNLKDKKPLVHNITNYVTVNDCANITLAIGASPIMADDEEEVEEIAAISDGLNINIGTLNTRTIVSMKKACIEANKRKIPILLDPVGVSVSKLRRRTVEDLLDQVDFSVISGNISEIKYLISGLGKSKGVDVNDEDRITEKNVDEFILEIKNLAKKYNTVIAMTGEIDIVSDGKTTYCIYNGNSMMEKVTGTGCQLSSLISSFIATDREDILGGVFAGVTAMGIAGELAFKRLKTNEGNIAYRNYIIDEIYNMDYEKWKDNVKYEIR